MDPNNHAPEVARQQANVEERRRAHAQQEGREAVEDKQTQRVADNVPNDGAVPGGLLEGVAVKDTGRRAADKHANEAHEAQHLVHGPARHVPLLKYVAEAVARGAGETKKIALELLGRVVVVGAGHGVAAQQHAHAAAGDEDAEELEGAVADLEEEEGDDDDADDGPKVEQLGREEVGVAVGQDGEVVALDIEEGEDKVLPAVGDDDAPDLAPAVAVEHVRHVDEAEQDVVEEGLEGRDIGAVVGEEGGEGAGGGVCEAEELAQGEDQPKVVRLKVRVPVDAFGFNLAEPRCDGRSLVAVGVAAGRPGVVGAVDVRLHGVGHCAIVVVVA